MPEINPTVSIITLSELNNPVKRQRLLYWIKEKKKIQLHAVYRRHTLDSTIQASRVNIKSMEIYIYICHASNSHKRTGVATPSDKTDFKTTKKYY